MSSPTMSAGRRAVRSLIALVVGAFAIFFVLCAGVAARANWGEVAGWLTVIVIATLLGLAWKYSGERQ